MSLNWREINALLDELPLTGSHIRQIRQPSHEQLVLELYDGRNYRLLISLSGRYCRLHRLTRVLPNPRTPPRFASFLRARVRGARVTDAYQIGQERVVKLVLQKGQTEMILWIRLWASAANIVVTDADGRILESFYRRPKRGEVAGGHYHPEAELSAQPSRGDYQIRDLSGDGDFNSRIEDCFFSLEEEGEFEGLKREIIGDLRQREAGLEIRRKKLTKQRENYAEPERYRELGDLLKSVLHRVEPATSQVEVEDFYHENTPVLIALDPSVTPAENADRYYKKHRAASRGLERIEEELESLRLAAAEVARRRETAENAGTLDSLHELREAVPRRKKSERKDTPGLQFRATGGHRIIVGRTSRDNDTLLRAHVKGNDYWFHARDWPGAYVFVRSQKGKSVPLEAMLDAGNLAIFYSKGRSSGAGDIYYTQVKYLRRARNGKSGLVLPTRERNLHIKLEKPRLDRLHRSQEVSE